MYWFYPKKQRKHKKYPTQYTSTQKQKHKTPTTHINIKTTQHKNNTCTCKYKNTTPSNQEFDHLKHHLHATPTKCKKYITQQNKKNITIVIPPHYHIVGENKKIEIAQIHKYTTQLQCKKL